MLETLSRGFRAARDRLRGEAELDDENVAEALRDVRLSLLEADVDLAITRDFLDRVRERCRGERVRLRASAAGKTARIGPSEWFVKACYDELVALMKSDAAPLERARAPRALMLLGLQGTGKTSTAAKLAAYLKRAGERPLLVAADVRRPAAREQLRVLGAQIDVPVFTREGEDAPAICEEAMAFARAERHHTVVLDTAGRLQIDDELMAELAEIERRVHPELAWLVCDAMAGREAVNVARGFAEKLRVDGLVLTKLDGDARGGAALAIRAATGVPIRFLTVGEAIDRLEPFRPEGLASRILGMGDVVGLVEDFEKVVDREEAERAEKDAQRLLRGQFTLTDFLTQLRLLQRMGPLSQLVEKIPFAADLMPAGAQVDPKELRRIEAMILSMTPDERVRPEIVERSRQDRIARGSGTRREDVVGLLDRFRAMREMMASVGKSLPKGMLGKLPGMGKLMGGGAPAGLPAGFDPAALLGGGAAPNRHAARAMKAQARKDKRKAMKKHKRRGKRR
jgi:signal recognition particle subunit SRP54